MAKLTQTEWTARFVEVVKFVDGLMPNAIEPLAAVLSAETMSMIRAAVETGILYRCGETGRYFAVKPEYKAAA